MLGGKTRFNSCRAPSDYSFSLSLCLSFQSTEVALCILCVYAFVCVCGHSVVIDSLWSHGLQPTRLLCPWDSPGKNTGVGCHALLQGIFLTQGSNPGLLTCRQIISHLSHQCTPGILCGWTASAPHAHSHTWAHSPPPVLLNRQVLLGPTGLCFNKLPGGSEVWDTLVWVNSRSYLVLRAYHGVTLGIGSGKRRKRLPRKGELLMVMKSSPCGHHGSLYFIRVKWLFPFKTPEFDIKLSMFFFLICWLLLLGPHPKTCHFLITAQIFIFPSFLAFHVSPVQQPASGSGLGCRLRWI